MSSKKAILIARVSTGEQKEHGYSLQAQIARLEEYCNRHDMDIVESYSFDESAFKKERREFDEILKTISKTKERVCVCFDKVDRLSRNIFDKRVATLYEKAVADEIELHFVSDAQVINNQMGAADKFAFGMKLGLAKYYSDAIGDSVRRAFEKKRKDGYWTGNAPFGYDNVPQNAEKRTRADLVVNKRDAYFVKEIFARYATGNYSLNTLCEWLNSEDSTTKVGGKWHSSALHFVLCNPFYYGMMRSKYGNIKHRYQPLVSRRQFLQVQEVLQKKNNNPVILKGAKKFIFGNGLFTCKNCGCLISAQEKKGGRYVYYHCTNSKKNCERIYTPERELLAQVNEILESLFMSEEQIDEACRYLKEQHDTHSISQREELSRLQSEYNRCQQSMDKALDAYLEGKLPEKVYDKKIKDYSLRQEKINHQIEDLTVDNKSHHITAKTILFLAKHSVDLFENSNIEEKQEILKLIFQNPMLDGKKLVFALRKPFDTVFEMSKHPNLLRR